MSSNSIKIAISGKSGCGNTTVSTLVAEKLGVKLINYTFRNIAKEKGIEFKELCRMAETDTSWDKYLDNKQIEMASEGNCVLGSRLAIWLFKEADLKVYLLAAPEVRAKRISNREHDDVAAVIEETAQRDTHDHERYLKLYNIDNDEYDFADLIIDTEQYNPDEIADLIIKELESTKAGAK